MKKNIIRLFMLSIISMVLWSCNFAVPKAIQVKAKPKVELSGGSDLFGVEKLKIALPNADITGTSAGSALATIAKDKLPEGFELYSYEPVDDVSYARMLARYRVEQKIEGLQIEDYLNNLDSANIAFGYEADKVTPKTLVDIPAVDTTPALTAVDVSSSLPTLSAGAQDISAVEPGGAGPITEDLPAVSINLGSTFSTATFATGSKLRFTFGNITDASGGYTLTLNTVTLKNASGDVISTASPLENLLDGGVVDLNIGGKTLTKDISLVFNITANGGTALDPVTIKLTSVATVDASITQATGLSFTKTTTVNEIISISVANLVSATIGAGSFDLNVPIPSGWSGVTAKVDNLSLTQTSGLNFSSGADKALPWTQDLAGQSLSTANITVAGDVVVTAVNATIDVTQTITPSAHFAITEFSTIKITVADLVSQLTQIKNQPLASVATYVNEMTFDKLGLKLTVYNGLPVDVTPTLKSDFIYGAGLTPGVGSTTPQVSSPATIPKNTTTATVVELAKGNGDDTVAENFTRTISGGTSLDIELKMGLSGLVGNELTMTNVSLPKKCTFYGKAEFIADWYSLEAQVDTSTMATALTGEVGPIDLSTIRDVLPSDFNIGDVTTRIFFDTSVLSDILGNTPTIKGFVNAKYTNVTPQNLYLIGNDDTAANNNDVITPHPLPTSFVTNATANGGAKITEDVSAYTPSATVPKIASDDGLEKVINAAPEDLKLKYGFDLGGGTISATVTKSALADGALDRISVAADVLIEVPLELTVTQTPGKTFDFNGDGTATPAYEYDILDKVGINPATAADLLGRKEATPEENIKMLIDAVTDAALTIGYDNKLGIGVALRIKDTNGAGTSWEKIISLKTGVGSAVLGLDATDREYIYATYPFYPDEIKLVLPTSISLNRDPSIDLSAQVKVATEIDQTIAIPGMGN